MGASQSTAVLNRGSSSQGGRGSEDIIALKQKISTLELENKQLKDQQEKDSAAKKKEAAVTNDDRNWMSSFGQSSGAGGGAAR